MRRRDFIAGVAGAAAWPLAALAQQQAVPVIGYLTSSTEGSSLVLSFHQGLRDQGFVEGLNLEVRNYSRLIRLIRLRFALSPGLRERRGWRRVRCVLQDGRLRQRSRGQHRPWRPILSGTHS